MCDLTNDCDVSSQIGTNLSYCVEPQTSVGLVTITVPSELGKLMDLIAVGFTKPIVRSLASSEVPSITI